MSHLERRAAWAEDTLTTLHEALIVANDVANLDDVAVHAVFEDLDRLSAQREGQPRSSPPTCPART